MMSPLAKLLYRGIVLIAFLFMFVGCSSVTAITHYFRSTDHFHPLDTDQRILYESGAEGFAEVLSTCLPNAVKIVEDSHYSRFTKDIKIYVCSTSESFNNMTGRAVKAITYRESVFLSPRLMEHPETVCSYLVHELSHLIMLQRLGLYKSVTMPPWFSEGLAVCVSGGGGAGDVTETEAIETVLAGRHFEPHDDGGILDFFFPKYGSHWELKPHMFYRQGMLFVSFIKEYDKEAFKDLLLNIQQGKSFDKSFQQTYNISTLQLWQLFIKQLKSEVEQKKAANRGAHLRRGRQAAGLTAEPAGEVPCSEARFAPRTRRSRGTRHKGAAPLSLVVWHLR